MNKRAILLILFTLLTLFQAHAVLKEQDLESTLSILRTELTNYHAELERQSGYMKSQQAAIRDKLFSIMGQSNQNALMLYSQKPEYVFDMAYACHEATEQYDDFKKNVQPFRLLIEKNKAEIARYDYLINSLSTMNVSTLSKKAQTDKSVCLTFAVNIRHTLNDNSNQFKDYINYYQEIEQQLKALNDYANKRYKNIQSGIFNNAGENYFNILTKFRTNYQETKEDITTKYFEDSNAESQWDASYIIGLFILIIFYAVIAGLINLLVIRFLIPKRFRTPAFISRRTCITMTTSVVSLALLLGVIRMIFFGQNFIIMACGLLVGYTWLLGVILISLLLRLSGEQIKSGFRIYLPLMAMGFIVIAFRIVLVPNSLIHIALCPVLLVCTIWQWIAIRHNNKNVPKSDVTYTYISLTVFLISFVCAWMGYTLLSVQLLIWWIMQLTCVLTITCLRGWLKKLAEKREYEKKDITQTWFFYAIYQVVLPILSVASFLLALYWAADVFNLSDKIWDIYKEKYINTKWFAANILSIAEVVALYFIFAYLNRTIKAFLKIHFENSDLSTAASRNIMAKNVVQVAVWGTWLIISLAMFHIDNTWLVVVSGGFSTGVGFAMKDILENIYYGISLMAGRVKIGDYIVFEGTRGRVSSINYTSTIVEATDGSIIAFQNSLLFTKSYKNMTKNHGYELDILEVGVAYGSDIKQVKQLLYDAITALKITAKKREVKIVLKEFGDNAITLKILVWVSVMTQYIDDGRIMECVYDTLNANNIEIPFPQRDIHIIHATPEQMETAANGGAI